MKVLVVNAGSSSLKYQVMDMDTEEIITKGLCERIGIDGRHTNKTDGNKYTEEVEMMNHTQALKVVVDCLLSDKVPAISSLAEIGAVGHRVLHGGELFNDSAVITDEVLAQLEELIPLGPLHQPANIAGVKACAELLPGVPQVAVFDTTFHATMPDYAYRYALPNEAYKKWKIRKYGFHGTSHKYIAGELEKLEGKKGNFIVCHIGNGASLSAIKDGKCIDTTMGYTPLEGVMMGTRCGDIDASVVESLMQNSGMTVNEVVNYMNKKSGLLGISEVSGDMRDVEEFAYNKEDTSEKAENCRLALNMHAYRVKKYIGAYYAALGTVDAICFTAGVGENGAEYRESVLVGLEGMGIVLDKDKNNNFKRGEVNVISTDDSKVKIYVIPTDEELMIAKDTQRLTK